MALDLVRVEFRRPGGRDACRRRRCALSRRRHVPDSRAERGRCLDPEIRARRRPRPRPHHARRRPITIGSAVTMAQVAKEPGLAFLRRWPSRSAVRRSGTWRPSAAISSRGAPMATSPWRCSRSARRWSARRSTAEKVEDLEAFIADGPKRRRHRPRGPIRDAAGGRFPLPQGHAEASRMARRCCRSRRSCR